MKILIPTFRQELVFRIADLSNLDYQKKEWRLKNRDDALWYGIELFFSFFIEDIDVLDVHLEPKESYFYDREEYGVVFQLVKFMQNNIKPTQKDVYYLSNPKWLQVVEMAKKAYDLLVENNHKYNFAKDLDDFNNMSPEELDQHFNCEET